MGVDDRFVRSIIEKDVAQDSRGARLTPEAQARGVDFAMKQTGRGLNFGQLRDIAVSHAEHGVVEPGR